MTGLSESVVAYLAAKSPKAWEKAEVAKYRTRLHDVLNREFNLMSFYQSGSFEHGTAITPYADVDYIARIHFQDQPTSSTTILNKMRDLLKSELWEADDVYVAQPTVTIQFSGVITYYEITPAYLERNVADDQQVVVIPASGGGWREAAPKAHLKFVRDMDKKHGGGVRRLTRLLKAWKYEHDVPISSFYLEMRAAEHGKNNDSFWILYAVGDVVAKLISTDLAAMNDPAKLVNRITACSSESNRLRALSALKEFRANLTKALAEDNSNGDRWTYNQRLQDIWGTNFPYTDPNTA